MELLRSVIANRTKRSKCGSSFCCQPISQRTSYKCKTKHKNNDHHYNNNDDGRRRSKSSSLCTSKTQANILKVCLVLSALSICIASMMGSRSLIYETTQPTSNHNNVDLVTTTSTTSIRRVTFSPSKILNYNDNNKYNNNNVDNKRRVVYLEERIGGYFKPKSNRKVRRLGSKTSSTKESFAYDITQKYPIMDSADTDNVTMLHGSFPNHDKLLGVDEHCVAKESWQFDLHPTCNEFHSFSMEEALVAKDQKLLAMHGAWRDIWRLNDNVNVETILKTFRFSHKMEHSYFEDGRVDALMMERMTASPFVIDIYGHCGLSVLTQIAGKQLSQLELRRVPSKIKLKLAYHISKGLADIHTDLGKSNSTVMVHYDINPANLMFGKNRMKPLWIDFNIGVLLTKHNETQQTCPFLGIHPNPQWKSPEEMLYAPRLTEKADIYALGNIFFSLAVNIGPWEIHGEDFTLAHANEIAKLKRDRGALPPVPKHVKESDDDNIQALLTIMRKCYHHDPLKRPSATEIVDFLYDKLY